MEYLSERITNISELEKLLETINIKAKIARKSTPYYSVTVDTDFIKLNETVIGVPTK